EDIVRAEPVRRHALPPQFPPEMHVMRDASMARICLGDLPRVQVFPGRKRHVPRETDVSSRPNRAVAAQAPSRIGGWKV
ncbi:hypothetical protein, partial [Serratia marcescens]|uniref:hypothetical protein n=1 Tax=Serratia marcescens TaxID=615 RepID=UPI0019548AD8